MMKTPGRWSMVTAASTTSITLSSYCVPFHILKFLKWFYWPSTRDMLRRVRGGQWIVR
ncbi:hypothetical protein DY000_02004777 [Brassica cretica]|uniref:Uncharacterized protein n=1 Tax=Brassica cretica TaxID=69181 RepID=A0ABQ7BYZ8_BRACR|nr:hypothetical protein DY000_02004777 [Brassica cretica]